MDKKTCRHCGDSINKKRELYVVQFNEDSYEFEYSHLMCENYYIYYKKIIEQKNKKE